MDTTTLPCKGLATFDTRAEARVAADRFTFRNGGRYITQPCPYGEHFHFLPRRPKAGRFVNARRRAARFAQMGA